ncbi:MAG: site-specific integrase, partial [Sulfurimonas sp.]
FYTGARTGEVLALTWNDIDLENRTISITKGLRNGVIGKPKTKSSVRDVPIFEPLVKHLKEHMNRSRSISLFVNPHTDKMFYKSAKLTPFWRNLLNECNLEYRILYSTRHTFISTMLKNSNLSMLDIAQIVGHANTEMIVRNYAKFIKGEHLKISRNLDIFTDKTTDTISQMA